MRWFRGHRRVASAAALLALAVQLVASFAHVHVMPAHAGPAIANEIRAAVAPSHRDENGPAGSHAPQGQSCDICATLAIAGGGQIALPPSLVQPPVAAIVLSPIADAVAVERRHSLAQSRAPPAA